MQQTNRTTTAQCRYHNETLQLSNKVGIQRKGDVIVLNSDCIKIETIVGEILIPSIIICQCATCSKLYKKKQHVK